MKQRGNNSNDNVVLALLLVQVEYLLKSSCSLLNRCVHAGHKGRNNDDVLCSHYNYSQWLLIFLINFIRLIALNIVYKFIGRLHKDSLNITRYSSSTNKKHPGCSVNDIWYKKYSFYQHWRRIWSVWMRKTWTLRFFKNFCFFNKARSWIYILIIILNFNKNLLL